MSEGIATGNVTFKDGSTTLGTGTLANGVATFTSSTLSAGTHNITATYAGDSNFNLSTSISWLHLVLDINSLDINKDGEIHIDDIIKIILQGTEEQRDFNHDGIYDVNDINLMLRVISSKVK